MNRENDAVFLQTLGRFIQTQVQLATTPLLQRIETLQAEIATLKNVTADMVLDAVAMESARIEKLIADIPKPEALNGKDGADGKPGLDGKDGKDAEVDYERVTETIEKRLVEEISKFSVKDGKDGADGKDGKDGNDGKDGRDGADVVGAFRKSDGHLILTLSNGEIKDIGPVHGKDGEPGKDGADGKDGRDGFGFDDFTMAFDGERTYTFVFSRGELRKEFKFVHKNTIYRGIWRQASFQCGDEVTYDGSMFVAKEDTDSVPGTPNSGWTLATKRGREGKPGVSGPPGKNGKDGKDGRHGRDLTQLGADGSKW